MSLYRYIIHYNYYRNLVQLKADKCMKLCLVNKSYTCMFWLDCILVWGEVLHVTNAYVRDVG